MALTVETGSIVPNADTYVSRADYIAYAAARNVTIPDDEVADSELRIAAQFIDSHERQLKGYRVDRDQPMAFPRHDLTIEDWAWGSDEIPRNVVLAQLAYALDIHAGEDPFNPEPNIVRNKLKVEGAVEFGYHVGDGHKLSKTSRADALLNSLLRPRSGLSIVGVRN